MADIGRARRHYYDANEMACFALIGGKLDAKLHRNKVLICGSMMSLADACLPHEINGHTLIDCYRPRRCRYEPPRRRCEAGVWPGVKLSHERDYMPIHSATLKYFWLFVEESVAARPSAGLMTCQLMTCEGGDAGIFRAKCE